MVEGGGLDNHQLALENSMRSDAQRDTTKVRDGGDLHTPDGPTGAWRVERTER